MLKQIYQTYRRLAREERKEMGEREKIFGTQGPRRNTEGSTGRARPITWCSVCLDVERHFDWLGRPMASVRSRTLPGGSTRRAASTRPPRSDCSRYRVQRRTIERFTRHYGLAGELRQRRRQQQQLGGREGERARGYVCRQRRCGCSGRLETQRCIPFDMAPSCVLSSVAIRIDPGDA